jgi:GNAT superfamily N-acetyltransferase
MDESILNESIETSMFLLPEVTGKVRTISLPGIRGRITDSSDFFANLVGASTLNPKNAEDTIRQVCRLFEREGKEFGWVIGPKSTPPHLAELLQRAGFTRKVEMAGMALSDLRVSIRTNPAVHIREASGEDLQPASELLAEALGITEEGANVITQALLWNRESPRTRVYLAYLDGVHDAVGIAAALYLPDHPIVDLYCAATLKAYRGRGIYSSLVARRIRDAFQEGMRAAIIQAVRETSAPICQKIGFLEIGKLEWYVWQGHGKN